MIRTNLAFGGLWKRVWSHHGISVSTKCKVYKAIVLPTLLYSAETYTLYRRHFRKLSKVHLRYLRQILQISWKDHIPNVEVLRRANMSSIEATLTASQLRWTGHIIRMKQITKGCILWRINRRETSSWWTTAAIQKTPKGYTHHRRPLRDPCKRSTTVEAGHTHRKKPHLRKDTTTMPTRSQSPPRPSIILLPLSSSVSTAGEGLNLKLDYSLTNKQST